MALKSAVVPVLFLLSMSSVNARECTPPLPQPPHELALSMLGLADAENFACEGQAPALRLTYFTWSGTKKVLKVFFPDSGPAFIEIYEIGKAPSAVTLEAQDQASLYEMFRASTYWQQEPAFWMMPMDRDAARQQQLLFVELSRSDATNLVWIDANDFRPDPLVSRMIDLAETDMGPFGSASREAQSPVVAVIPPVPSIKPEVVTAPAPVMTAPAVVAPAAKPVNLISLMAGTWVFTHGDQSGRRVITPRFGGLVAEISETFDNSETRGIGLIAYDPTRDEYLETMTFNIAGAVGVLRGVPDEEGRRIRFTPFFGTEAQATRRVIFTMVSEEHFFFQIQNRNDAAEWVTTSQADFHRSGDATP